MLIDRMIVIGEPDLLTVLEDEAKAGLFPAAFGFPDVKIYFFNFDAFSCGFLHTYYLALYS